jgi:hypothetical protein
VCRDSNGDGWEGGYIEIGGTKYCENFNEGRIATHNVPMHGKANFRDIFFYELFKNQMLLVEKF